MTGVISEEKNIPLSLKKSFALRFVRMQEVFSLFATSRERLARYGKENVVHFALCDFKIGEKLGMLQ